MSYGKSVFFIGLFFLLTATNLYAQSQALDIVNQGCDCSNEKLYMVLSIFFFTLTLLLFIYIKKGSYLLSKINNEKQKKLDEILFLLPVPILITNNQTRKVVFANSYACDTYKIDYEDFIDLPIDTLYTDLSQRDDILNSLDESGKLINFETVFKKGDGTYIDALLSLIPIIYNNQECRAGIIADITELKNAQAELEYLNHTLEDKIKLELDKNKKQQIIFFQHARHAQMGEMISMIAHQWRQPLNVLSLLIQKHEQKYLKNRLDKEIFEQFVLKSMSQISNMTNTIEDFRNFFRQGKEEESFNLFESVDSVIKLIEPVLNQDKIKVYLECEKDIFILGFSNEFRQALINIFNNAQDALVENKIENKTIYIKALRKKENIKLIIYDNAGGVEQDKIHNIFEPYFSTKGEKGTGLGLYMTKLIIEDNMSGHIEVCNNDHGAQFTIDLNPSAV